MPVHHILLVDDEQHIVDVVEYLLVEDHFDVTVSMDGDSALSRVRERPFDLVILDLGLPGLSGWDLFKAMRTTRPELPVIMLTSRGEEIDRIVGLELGADDYVSKPFSTRELVARVKAVLRRSGDHRTIEDPHPDGNHSARGLSLDSDGYCALLQGKRIPLTKGEFRIIEGLLTYPARVFTRDELIARIYDGEHPSADRSIDAYIKRLRHKFAEAAPGTEVIVTVHGIGYRLAPAKHGAGREP